MKQVTAVMFAIVTVLASPAWAQKASSDHSAHGSTKASRSVPLAEGEIRKIDKAGKKITLKHGPIPNIDMPAMTMVFAPRSRTPNVWFAAISSHARMHRRQRIQRL